MKERPIIMQASNVRAILAGAKTQTRRIVKKVRDPDFGCELAPSELAADRRDVIERVCPYGGVGDRLWVREGWCYAVDDERVDETAALYRADDRGHDVVKCDGDGFTVFNKDGSEASPWLSPMFMPRRLSRITLELTDIRVERLQNISEEDARAEGCSASGWTPSYANPDNAAGAESRSAADHYAELWESIHGDDAWDANPWVWVLTFKRIAA